MPAILCEAGSQILYEAQARHSAWPLVVPDRAHLALATEKLERISLVDVANQIPIDAVADHALKPLRKLGSNFAWDTELLILLLTEKARAVVHRDSDSSLIRHVCAAAVPETSVPDEHATALHLCWNRIDLRISIDRTIGIFMTAGNDSRRAIGLGEIRDRPHTVADHRVMGSRQSDQLIIGMNRLRRFAMANADRRDRRDEATVIENTFHDR